MNSRPEITVMLSLSIQRHICPNNDPRIYWAREVTFDYDPAASVVHVRNNGHWALFDYLGRRLTEFRTEVPEPCGPEICR